MSGNSDLSYTNYGKIGQAAQTLLPLMMRELLYVEEPPHLIDGHARNNHNFYYKLRLSERKLISTANAKGYNDFDIPLMYKIFRNFSKVTPPTNGWASPIDPNTKETTIGDDIERIRRLRNLIVHWGNTNATKAELTNYFELFKDIAKRFETYLKKSSRHFVKKFEDLENDSSIEDQIKDNIHNIDCLKEAEQKLTKDMLILKQNVEDLITSDVIDVLLDEMGKLDTHYVETDIVNEVLNQFKSHNVVTITGISGIGKSATIYHIAFYLRDFEGYEIIPCYAPGDILSSFKKERKTIFVIDDVCGKYEVVKSSVDIWMQYESHLRSVVLQKGQNKLLTSCRLQVYNDDYFKKLKIFTTCSVELSRYTLTQKMEIAQRYLPLDVIKSINGVIDKCDFFPLMCSLYDAELCYDPVEFFRNQFVFYQKEFDEIKHLDDKTKYFALTLIVLCNGSLKFEVQSSLTNGTIKQYEFMQNLFQSYNISNETPPINIIKQLDSLVGTFLKRLYSTKLETLTYKPYNDNIFDYLAFHCGCNFQIQFITHANSSIISQRTQLKSLSTEPKDPIIIQIDNENEELYFTRIMQDILEGKSGDVFHCRQIGHGEYRSMLIAFMLSNGTEIRKLFLEGEVGKNILINICSTGYYDLIQCICEIMGSVSALLKPLRSRLSTSICKSKRINSPCIKLCVFGKDHLYTPLVVSSYYGYSSFTKLLIANGAKVNCVASYGGMTPLIAAILGSHMNVFELLIEKGASKNLSDKQKCSPLMWACRLGLNSATEILLDMTSNDSDTVQQKTTAHIDQTDVRGQTALMFACRYGHVDIVHKLVWKGADIRKTSQKNWTALFAGCRGGNLEIVTFLLENNAKINEQDKTGRTPLFIACKQKSENVVRLLLDRGADVNLPDKHGVTPTSIMEQNNWSLTKDTIIGKTTVSAVKTTDNLQNRSDIEPLSSSVEINTGIQTDTITSI